MKQFEELLTEYRMWTGKGNLIQANRCVADMMEILWGLAPKPVEGGAETYTGDAKFYIKTPIAITDATITQDEAEKSETKPKAAPKPKTKAPAKPKPRA